MVATLDKLQNWGLTLLIFLLPVFLLPITSNFFDFNKQALLVAGVLLLAVAWAARGIVSGKLTFTTSTLHIPVLLVAAVFLLSALFQSPNKMNAFLMPGIATTISAATFLYFLIAQTAVDKEKVVRQIIYALLFSALIVALVAITAGTGILEKLPVLPAWTKFKTFSLIGGPLPTVTFLIVSLVLGVSGAVKNLKKPTGVLLIAYSLVLILGIAAVGLQIAPGKPASPKLLPFSTGWAVAVETLKTSPLGVGPGSFLSAFNQYKPLSFNKTDVWNFRFIESSNWYLQLFTETGVVGLVIFLFLVWQVIRVGRWKVEGGGWNAIRYALVGILILFVLVPASFLLLITFYLLLGLAAAMQGKVAQVSLVANEKEEGAGFLAIVVFLLVLAVAAPVLFFGGQAYAAEMTYKKALDAANRNDGQKLYDLMRAAVSASPNDDRYRISFSQTNLALANVLSQKKDLTDQDKQTISQLVQQAIAQGQAAVALNTRLSNNWENLANIYRSLIPFAQGADQYAVATYSQAIALEPVNPLLRVTLGGVHYGAGRYEEAVKAFELATEAKPDFANAHYNLAVALREKGDIARAVTEMEQVLALVSPGSKDYETAQKELANLKSKLPTKPAASLPGETLEAPQPSPKPVIKPPLELPQEATPPASIESGPAGPSPTPSE